VRVHPATGAGVGRGVGAGVGAGVTGGTMGVGAGKGGSTGDAEGLGAGTTGVGSGVTVGGSSGETGVTAGGDVGSGVTGPGAVEGSSPCVGFVAGPWDVDGALLGVDATAVLGFLVGLGDAFGRPCVDPSATLIGSSSAVGDRSLPMVVAAATMGRTSVKQRNATEVVASHGARPRAGLTARSLGVTLGRRETDGRPTGSGDGACAIRSLGSAIRIFRTLVLLRRRVPRRREARA
jgi:hypothetical protein